MQYTNSDLSTNYLYSVVYMEPSDSRLNGLTCRLMEIERREANAQVTSTFPVGGHTQPNPQPHPQWGGETTRPQNYTSHMNAAYYQGREPQPPPGKVQHVTASSSAGALYIEQG